MFTASFVITEECNLSCDYCYMNNRKELMSRDTFDYHYEVTLPFFMDHYNQSEYTLDLFGGEPLQNWFMIAHIANKTKDDPRLKSIRLMTNGLLLNDQRVNFIKRHEIKASLSFDGLWAQYLKTYVSLKPRLQRLFNSCSVCITPRHMNMAENFRFLMDEFQLIPQFKIVRDNIWSESDVKNFKLNLDELEKVFFEYFDKGLLHFPSLLEHRLLMLLESAAHQISKIRCFVGLNGAAFAPNGKVYPCARFLTDDYYPIFDNVVLKENLDIIDDTAKLFSNDCQKCELGDHCDYMCLHQEMLNNGVIKNVCEIYKAIESKVLDINDRMRENTEWRRYLQEQTRRVRNG